MAKKETNKETLLDSLKKKVAEADVAYYSDGRPIMTDAEYDALRDEIDRMVGTRWNKVGSSGNNNKCHLPIPMASLNKIRDDPAKLDDFLRGDKIRVVMDKLDGNSGLLEVSTDGALSLYSRGDGVQGTDLTRMLPHVRVKQSTKKVGNKSGHFFVKGELIIRRRPGEAEPSKKNLRNYVAGLLHRKSAVDDEIATAGIEFVAYSLVVSETDRIMDTPRRQLERLASLGFIVVPYEFLTPESPESQESSESRLTSTLRRRKAESPYEIDGLVLVAADEPSEPPSLDNPTRTIAFKSLELHEEAIVRVAGIEWNVSKDGLMKPVALLDPPARLGGVVISRVTAINAAFVRDNVLGPGAVVAIVRSGDVIPKIVRVVVGSSVESMPTRPYEWTGAKEIRVKHDDSEAGVRVGIARLVHFVETLEIDGLGPSITAKLFESGYETPASLVRATESDLVAIEGIQARRAAKIVAAVADALGRATLVDLAVASNAFGHGIGRRKLAEILAVVDYRRDDVRREEVLAIDGCGAATADAYLAGRPAFVAFVDGLSIGTSKAAAAAFDGSGWRSQTTPTTETTRTLVVSGFRSKEFEDRVRILGWRVAPTLTKSTELLVVSDDNKESGKVVAARARGVRVVTVTEFFRLYG